LETTLLRAASLGSLSKFLLPLREVLEVTI